MGDIVDFALRRATRAVPRPAAGTSAGPAETFVLVPNERLAQLRAAWVQLKQQVQAQQPPARRR